MNGTDTAGLLLGAITSAGVAWLSVQLVPGLPHQIKPVLLFMYAGHFLWNSVIAGVDVAMRAFYPEVRVNPGYVRCPCRIPEGTTRDVFLAISSLVPGSLPAGVDEGQVVLHCLDLTLPVAAQMAGNESSFLKALGKDLSDD